MVRHDYGRMDRLLHRLALGLPALAELSFDLDQRASGAAHRADAVAGQPHVFVTGLARAGTTILLRHLHDSRRFRSLTYRDMPFPLAPNLWRRVSARWRKGRSADAPARQRAHGDGIPVDADSPEALEELFWRIQSGSDYIRRHGLLPHQPDDHVMTLFRRYVAAIMASPDAGQARYLSKNNNNILRLPALQQGFPAALFVIPFRHPADHALSLWRQHRHFRALQRHSPFIRTYMDGLAHHEFGLGQRPFLIGGPPPPHLTPDVPDYWLDMWIRVHRHLVGQANGRMLLVCHEELCTDPAVWRRLLDRLDLPPGQPSRFSAPPGKLPKNPAENRDSNFDPAGLREASALYDHLRLLAHLHARRDEQVRIFRLAS
ncbi:sulfotransferase [Sphingobium sufflavum]|uniref:sulfotransferase n=1 Tax=Sphingobium sufflavum TaxID=1129547 RepID=UPI001F3CD7CB|nr:sulfotransferase [Sphingobium sufflavum]MCE7795983.1 sulfotransferase [Sphingobium sufflavum]